MRCFGQLLGSVGLVAGMLRGSALSLALFGVSVVCCGGSPAGGPVAKPGTSGQAPTAVSNEARLAAKTPSTAAGTASAAAPTAAGNLLADPTPGHFVQIGCADQLPHGPDDEPPSFADIGPGPDASAWVVGSPSVRARVRGTPTSMVPDPPAPVAKSCYPPPHTTSCNAHAVLTSVTVRSAGEAYVAGGLLCGLDPNCAWPRGVERFDGSSWRALPRGASIGSEGHSPQILSVSPDGALHAIAVRREAPAYPDEEVIARYEGGDWQTLRAAVGPAARQCFERALADPASVAQIDPSLEHESYAALDAVSREVVWVAGARIHVRKLLEAQVKGQLPQGWQTGSVWRRTGEQWKRLDAGSSALVDIRAVSATEAWAVGDGLWHFTGDAVLAVPVALGAGEALVTLWVASTGDVWLGTSSGAVYRLEAGRARQVAALAPELRELRLRGYGQDVWATGGRCVWRWQPGARASP